MHHYQPDNQLLHDRIVLVTGASSGIGRQIAKSYAAHGATVILLARSIDKLESVYDEIVAQGSPQPAIYPCNLASASPRDYDDMATQIQKEFGRIDGLLHNAATIGSLTPIEHYDVRQWYSVMQVCLNAPFMLTRSLLPLLKESKDASIIFTDDDVANDGRAYWGAYGVAKSAGSSLRNILAEELEYYVNIRVNSINPGQVHTALRAHAFPAENSEGLVEPDSLAPAYLYLMGPDSQGITGSCLQVQAEPVESGQLFNISSD